jgi:hypothetical protein
MKVQGGAKALLIAGSGGVKWRGCRQAEGLIQGEKLIGFHSYGKNPIASNEIKALIALGSLLQQSDSLLPQDSDSRGKATISARLSAAA